jgi:molecular chaperone HscC
MIGIDLGTTNSAIAVWHDGRPRLIPNSTDTVRSQGGTHPGMTATAFKRYMGTNRVGDREFLPEELSALVPWYSYIDPSKRI